MSSVAFRQRGLGRCSLTGPRPASRSGNAVFLGHRCGHGRSRSGASKLQQKPPAAESASSLSAHPVRAPRGCACPPPSPATASFLRRLPCLLSLVPQAPEGDSGSGSPLKPQHPHRGLAQTRGLTGQLINIRMNVLIQTNVHDFKISVETGCPALSSKTTIGERNCDSRPGGGGSSFVTSGLHVE